MLLFLSSKTGHNAKKHFAIRPNSYFSRTYYSVVILRSPANSGTTKNLEILCGVYPFNRLRAGSESAERLRMTAGCIQCVVGQYLVTNDKMWR